MTKKRLYLTIIVGFTALMFEVPAVWQPRANHAVGLVSYRQVATAATAARPAHNAGQTVAPGGD